MINQVRFHFPDVTPEQNLELVQESDAEREALPGSSLGAMRSGGWSSLKREGRHWGDAMQHLATRFFYACPAEAQDKALVDHIVTVWCWHVQLGPRQAVDFHDHHKAIWSGVYYPKGNAGLRGGGRLVLKHGADRYFPVEVQEGLLVTFPPTLMHAVEEFPDHPHYIGEKAVRYSISFNLHPASEVGY